MNYKSLLLLLFVIPLIGGCAQVELASHFGKQAVNGHSKGSYKVGSPYRIKGKKYYPKVDYDYKKTGVASWYGPGFHGKKTANGETYDQNALTAAHKTLPLPSIVKVTNLRNGKSLIVRVNDRGPYAHGRIIDMSKRGAELLGFKNQGTAKVKVEVLEAESRQVALAAQNGRSTRNMEVAMNKRSYKSPTYKTATNKAPKVNAVRAAKIVTSPPRLPSKRLFVQMGSFSTREAAMKYASSLDSYGRALIQPAIVDGTTYYRVRLPAINTASADNLLRQVSSRGYKTARIVVD